MSNPKTRIAIVGGGPAGLTLGLLLHKHGIPFAVFELRQRPTDEELAEPSGSLDMHEKSGLAALRACGLFDEAISLTGDCTEEQKIAAKNGNIIYEDADGSSENRPELYRHDLLKLLLSHLPSDSIQWGCKLVSAKRIADSGVELDFGAKGKHVFDLVVGADGAWSRVRPLLTDTKPRYAGIHNITINVRQIGTKRKDLAALIGSGTFTCLANRHGVFSQRATQDSARIYVMISTEDEHFGTTSGLASKTPTQAKDPLTGGDGILSQWGEIIKQLVGVACDDESAHNGGAYLDIKPFHTLPAGNTWEHRSDATLIGDAAHLMNPPAGEGVNIAMLDALLLSQAIAKAHKTAGPGLSSFGEALDSSIREFEVDMAKRALEMAEGTQEVSKVMFGGEDGSTDMANWFRQMFRSQK
ncbi:salicylate hydroxylase [Lentithecium fluviatile CBS 122367]|uniref:Salicylate hydroxylase n=1 Tax=Lentithecium fluviatile CBS 122367 TaxID=1168545 RepID=A0A6G1IDZ9_9PLEO|nr:salicylate hydroxylase [Lentithecium fluviatile CBS 122367]